MTVEEMKRWIDTADYTELLRRWRFAKAGDPFFQGEVGDYYAKVLAARRDTDPEGHVRASKAIGWDV